MSATHSNSNVDPEELGKFEALAHRWWDPEGEFRPLHQINPLRLDWIRQFVNLDGAKAVDIGCGGGILSESMAGLGARVTGIDVVEKNIFIATVHAQSQQLDIDYQHRTAESVAESGQAYDVILNMEVVEHVADLRAFMASCNRLTAPNGIMFVATINRTWLAWLFAILGAEYILKWLPRGTHRWSEFRKPSEITSFFNRGGLELQAQSGVAVNPLTRGFRLSRNMNVNYMLMATRPGDGV